MFTSRKMSKRKKFSALCLIAIVLCPLVVNSPIGGLFADLLKSGIRTSQKVHPVPHASSRITDPEENWLFSSNISRDFELYEGDYYLNFSAVGESYVICHVTDVSFVNFTIISPTGTSKLYWASWGRNYFPIDFAGVEFQNYTLSIPDEFVPYIEDISVQPLYLESFSMQFNFSTDGVIEQQDMYFVEFSGVGDISILFDINFPLNSLFLELDGIPLQTLHEWSADYGNEFNGVPMIDARTQAEIFEGKDFLQYDLVLDYGPDGNGRHELGWAAESFGETEWNGTNWLNRFGEICDAEFGVVIMCNDDWDGDLLGDSNEINILNTLPVFANSYGTFTRAPFHDDRDVIPDELPWDELIYEFNYNGDEPALLFVLAAWGNFYNISVDGLVDPSEIYSGTSVPIGIMIKPGSHVLKALYNSSEPMFEIHFYVGGMEIWDINRADWDTLFSNEPQIRDGDSDGMPDEDDLSPLNSLDVTPDKIQRFVFPTKNKNTQILFQVARPELDLYDLTHHGSRVTPLLWKEETYVEVLPVIRQFSNLKTEMYYWEISMSNMLGSSTLEAPYTWAAPITSPADFSETWGKDIETYSLAGENFNESNLLDYPAIDRDKDGIPDLSSKDRLKAYDQIGYWILGEYSHSFRADKLYPLYQEYMEEMSPRELKVILATPTENSFE